MCWFADWVTLLSARWKYKIMRIILRYACSQCKPCGFHKLHFKYGNIYYGVFTQYVYTVVCCYTVVFLWSCSCVMCWCHEWAGFTPFKLRGTNDIKILGQCFPVRPLKDNERKSLLADQGTRQLQELTFTHQRWDWCSFSGYIRMRVAV